MILMRGLFQPHWFYDSVIWTAATSIESLKKELSLHQGDSDPGPFQLFRFTSPFHPLSRELLLFYTWVIGAIYSTQIWISMTETVSSWIWGWARGPRQTGGILEPLLPSALPLHAPWLELCALNSKVKKPNLCFSCKRLSYTVRFL